MRAFNERKHQAELDADRDVSLTERENNQEKINKKYGVDGPVIVKFGKFDKGGEFVEHEYPFMNRF